MMDSVSVNQQDNATPKIKLEWTLELHSKFVDAVDSLGGFENAVPSQILRLMNEPGLTREHVASHLQKYRQLKRTGLKRINKFARLDQQFQQSRR